MNPAEETGEVAVTLQYQEDFLHLLILRRSSPLLLLQLRDKQQTCNLVLLVKMI